MSGEVGALTLTGERTLPGIWHENYWFRRHEVAYRWLSGQVTGVVLEAGCGEGYGAEALRAAGHATQVVAVDYDVSAVAHVRATYPEVAVIRGNLVALPLRSGRLDAVVSLQTVEHLWDQPLFVAECARVLRPGGLLAVSTPNRLTFSPGVGRGEKPLNPFHVNEFDPAELVELLATRVSVEAVLGVGPGERIQDWERRYGSLVAAQLSAPYAQWSEPLRSFVAELTSADFIVSADDVDSSLDLLVVGRA